MARQRTIERDRWDYGDAGTGEDSLLTRVLINVGLMREEAELVGTACHAVTGDAEGGVDRADIEDNTTSYMANAGYEVTFSGEDPEAVADTPDDGDHANDAGNDGSNCGASVP